MDILDAIEHLLILCHELVFPLIYYIFSNPKRIIFLWHRLIIKIFHQVKIIIQYRMNYLNDQ